MDDHNILQHLLNLETEAAALVDDAQAEADRRVAEGEKKNRLRYDEAYTREAETLEGSYARHMEDIKNNYQKQLDTYHDKLKTTPLDTGAFSALAEKFLLIREP